MEQSIPRHFIFSNNPAFLFRQWSNPNTGHLIVMVATPRVAVLKAGMGLCPGRDVPPWLSGVNVAQAKGQEDVGGRGRQDCPTLCSQSRAPGGPCPAAGASVEGPHPALPVMSASLVFVPISCTMWP